MGENVRKEDLEGAPFILKLYALVEEPSTNEYVSWSNDKNSFVVWKPVEFGHEVLPKYFKHNNFCSFIRQLNFYGFHKVESKQWEFKHELFKSGQTKSLKHIHRKTAKKRTDTGAEIEESKEEPKLQRQKSQPELTDPSEVEKLKTINNLLLHEIQRLQVQQDATQSTIQQILDQLIESRREQATLHSKVELLQQEVKKPRNSLTEEKQYHQVLSEPILKGGFTPDIKNLQQFGYVPTSSPNSGLDSFSDDFDQFDLDAPIDPLLLEQFLQISSHELGWVPESPLHPQSPLHAPQSPLHQ